MICPYDKEAMVLVDSQYSIELEIEHGCPCRIDTYVCPKCHFEQQTEQWINLKNRKVYPYTPLSTEGGESQK